MTTIIEQTNWQDLSKYRHWSICRMGHNAFFVQHHETRAPLHVNKIHYKRLGAEAVPAGAVLHFFRKNQKLAGAPRMEAAFRGWVDQHLKEVAIPMDVVEH
jgi:hypothetical protein